MLSNVPSLWTLQPHSSLRIWAFAPRPRSRKHISPVIMGRFIFSGRVLSRHKLTQVRNAKVNNLKTEKATKEHIALAQYMRGPGHQALQEATVHSLLSPIPSLAAVCCNECWMQKKKKSVSHSPHLPMHLREKQALHWRERKNRKKILTITRKRSGLCFQNPASTLWNWGSSFNPQDQLQIPSYTRTGYSWVFSVLSF